MHRKRKWLVNFSRQDSNPHYSTRRIVAPERLECRIAPGVMLPLFGSLLDGPTGSAVEAENNYLHERVERPLHRSEWVAIPPDYRPISREPLVEPIQLKPEPVVSNPSPAVASPQIPYQIAALDAAFGSLAGELNNGLSPRLIQPVIMDPESPHNQVEAPPTLVTETTSPATSARLGSELDEPTDSGFADGSFPLSAAKEMAAPVVVPVDLGPRIIQPVIMDPESEHNAPSPPDSTQSAM